jgi:hypothetical protein
MTRECPTLESCIWRPHWEGGQGFQKRKDLYGGQRKHHESALKVSLAHLHRMAALQFGATGRGGYTDDVG